MSSRDVRRGVTRGGWNKQNASWYSLHYAFMCILIAWFSESWWTFLAMLLLCAVIEYTNSGGKIMLLVFCSPWVALFGSIGMAIDGIPAACVFGLLAGCMAYVILDSGREYYQDL